MAWSFFWPKATSLPAPNTHRGEKTTGRLPELEQKVKL